jgi:hypothetical protein
MNQTHPIASPARRRAPSFWTIAAIAAGLSCWVIGTMAGLHIAGDYDADQARYLGAETPSLEYAIMGGLLSASAALLGAIVGAALFLLGKLVTRGCGPVSGPNL